MHYQIRVSVRLIFFVFLLFFPKRQHRVPVVLPPGGSGGGESARSVARGGGSADKSGPSKKVMVFVAHDRKMSQSVSGGSLGGPRGDLCQIVVILEVKIVPKWVPKSCRNANLLKRCFL